MYPFECRVPKIARRDKKAFLSDQCNEIEKTIEWERLEISSRKLEIPREHSCKDGHNAAAAAAAAKSLQSCPTLCNPIDGSPPGPAVPGILQARTLEWVAISSSNA